MTDLLPIRAWKYTNVDHEAFTAIATCSCGVEYWLPAVYCSEQDALRAASKYRDEMGERCVHDVANTPSATATVTLNPAAGEAL